MQVAQETFSAIQSASEGSTAVAASITTVEKALPFSGRLSQGSTVMPPVTPAAGRARKPETSLSGVVAHTARGSALSASMSAATRSLATSRWPSGARM